MTFDIAILVKCSVCVLSGHLSLSGRGNTGDTVNIQLANWVKIQENAIKYMYKIQIQRQITIFFITEHSGPVKCLKNG